MSCFDKTDFTPPHIGPNVLPNSPFFSELLRHASSLKHTAIRDLNQGGLSKTYAELLTDALRLRNVLRERLPTDFLSRIQADREDICIGVLAAGGYEYVVGILAVLALGATVIPMTIALPVREAMFFVRKSKQIAIVTSEGASNLGASIAEAVNEGGAPFDDRYPVESIPVMSSLRHAPSIAVESVSICSDRYLSDNQAGIVIFTSGTTGPPKGAVLRRGYIHESSRSVAAHFALKPNDTLLHLLPVHHVTGLAINILPFLIAGACIEFRSGSFDPEWTWNRWRDGASGAAEPLTIFSGVPTIYQRMQRYFEAHIAKLAEGERRAYERGAGIFRAMICGTSALPRPVAQFWGKLRGGQAILTRYGSTEVGAILRVPLDARDVPEGTTGVVVPGAELKLVDSETGQEGDEGEIWVKTPELFAKYLDDPQATKETYSEDGWFKTGDVGRREGRWYWIIGRASQDIIKSGGYKISALDVEREILGLPYIGEVMVARIPDEEFGERVAAAVTLREGQEVNKLSIDRLRCDLREHMASYKMPTLLRVMNDELPKTASGKVLKKLLGPQLFPGSGHPDVQTWNAGKSKL